MLTGIVFGLVPALQASKTDLSRGAQGRPQHRRRRRTAAARATLLVVVEVALSVVLLVSAGLTVRTFVALQTLDPGHQAERVLLVERAAAAGERTRRSSSATRSRSELLERVGGLPGVEAATFGMPFGGPQTPFTIAGQTTTSRGGSVSTCRRRRPPAHVRHPAARADACSTRRSRSAAIASR